MKNTNKSYKVFEFVIAIVIIPLVYYLIWSGFEFIQKPGTFSKRAAIEDVVLDFVGMIRDPGSESGIGGNDSNDNNDNNDNNDKKEFEALTEIMNIKSDNVSGSGKDIETLERLCSGNRFVTGVERNDKGYYFKDLSGSIESDDGKNVLHVCPNVLKCPEGNAMPRIICQDIQNGVTGKSLMSEEFRSPEISSLQIKPVMRIRKQDFNVMDERPVIGIIIRDQEYKTYDTIVITVNNFSDKYKGEYYGQYIQEFNFLGYFNSLEVSSEKVFGKDQKGSSTRADENPDIRIYWYGQVEVWFEKLIIDDYWGYNLFSSENSEGGTFDFKISECSTKDNFGYILNKVKESENINISNRLCINYVINKMYNSLQKVQYARAK